MGHVLPSLPGDDMGYNGPPPRDLKEMKESLFCPSIRDIDDYEKMFRGDNDRWTSGDSGCIITVVFSFFALVVLGLSAALLLL